MIPLRGKNGTAEVIPQNGRLLRAEYDMNGNLASLYAIEKEGSTKPVGMNLYVSDFDGRRSDFKEPEGSSGYYSLGREKGSDAIDVCYGTIWEDSQRTIKSSTFEEWVDECARIMSGQQEQVAQ